MSERRIDDVTGSVIERGRSFRLQFAGGMYSSGLCVDTQDVEALLRIVREKLTAKSSSAPLEIQLHTVEWLPLPNEFRKYAPEPEPEPEPPADDSPFGEIKSFKVPTFGYSPKTAYSYLRTTPDFPSYLRAPAPPAERAVAEARLDKMRRKYAAALADFCGCKDVNAHEENLR